MAYFEPAPRDTRGWSAGSGPGFDSSVNSTTPWQGAQRAVSLELRWPAVLLLCGVLAALVAGCSLAAAQPPAAAVAARSNATLGAPNAPVASPPPSAVDLQQTVINVIRAVQPSVVEITSRSGRGTAIGSGEIVTADGYIVTNDHVVQGFNSFNVTLANGQSLAATLRGQAPNDDLAVLKVDASNLHPIAFGSSANVQVGQFTIAIGSPLGLEQSATFGIVSALNRSASEGPGGPAAQLTGLIQTSAPINPGNSGGALVDLQGKLIGVPTLGAANPESGSAADGIGFAIPSDRVNVVAQDLIKNGGSGGQTTPTTGQGFLGIRGQDVTPELAGAYNLPVDSGVLIVAFAGDASGNSPAEQAGLRPGDIIVGFNGQAIASQANLVSALSASRAGSQVTLKVVRGSQQLSIKVTLGQRPGNS